MVKECLDCNGFCCYDSRRASYPEAAWWSRWCCCRGRSPFRSELGSGKRILSRESARWRSRCWSRCTHLLHCPHLNPEGHTNDILWFWSGSIWTFWCLCARPLCVYLVVEPYLVLQDVSVGPVWLRPWEGDGVWGSAQLLHHGNSTGNCGKTSSWARLDQRGVCCVATTRGQYERMYSES